MASWLCNSTGTTLVDSAGNMPGTLTNGPTFGADARDLVAASAHYVSFAPNSAVKVGGGDYTTFARVRHALISGFQNYYRADVDSPRQLVVSYLAVGSVIHAGNGLYMDFSSGVPAAVGAWIDVAVTRVRSSSPLSIYVDGVSVVTGTGTGSTIDLDTAGTCTSSGRRATVTSTSTARWGSLSFTAARFRRRRSRRSTPIRTRCTGPPTRRCSSGAGGPRDADPHHSRQHVA